LTSLLNVAQIGSQRPRIESFPLYSTTAADDAIDLAAIAGLQLDPWQEYVLRGALGERRDGRWTSFRTCLVVPRQNGKNAILEARELAGLFLFGEKLIMHTAHEFKTAYRSMTELMNRLKLVPELMEQVQGFSGEDIENIKDVDGFKTGNNPGITLKNGNQLLYAARSKGSGRGFTGNLVVLDEAYALKQDEMAALLPTMAAKSIEGNPQVWFTSSAGMADSDLLANLREQGKNKSSDRLAYFEWSAEDGADPADRDAWYLANPGLGIRISEEFVQDEYDTLVLGEGDDEQFKRERLGIWATLGGESVIDAEKWRQCRDEPLIALAEAGLPADNPLDSVAFSLDIPPSRDMATITMAGYRPDGTVYAEVIDRRVGVSWAPSRLAQLQASHSPVAIVVDGGSAAGALLPDMKTAKVRTKQLSPREYFLACGQVFDLIDQTKLRHSGQEELDAAIAAARQKNMGPSLWKWTRGDDVLKDISPLVGLTLAWFGLQAKTRKTTTTGKVRILS
jgi:phage terminase large subunit-like protein